MTKQTESPPKKKRHLIPKEYLLAVADRLHSTIPTKEITYNTVKDIWCDGYARGYLGRIDDGRHFRHAREADIKAEFDKIKDELDDELHEK